MTESMVLHDAKSHAAFNFDCFDLRNPMVALMMLPASCDTEASANGVTLHLISIAMI